MVFSIKLKYPILELFATLNRAFPSAAEEPGRLLANLIRERHLSKTESTLENEPAIA
jgi:hypothetical protein